MGKEEMHRAQLLSDRFRVSASSKCTQSDWFWIYVHWYWLCSSCTCV